MKDYLDSPQDDSGYEVGYGKPCCIAIIPVTGEMMKKV